MKRILYSFGLLVLGITGITSCDNGNADTIVLDSPPAVAIVSPGNFVLEGTAWNLTVEFRDGFNEELSRSPLASATWSIFENDSATQVTTGTFTVSGISTNINQPFAGSLSPGDYFFNVSAADTKGNTSTAYKKFRVIANFTTVGIIGSATPGGWGASTPMVQNAGNPALWELNSIVLVNGEAKFRANNEWAVNWGASTFPNGVGTQDGPNIPVTAGTYKVTLNITSGEYKFE